MNFNSDYQSYFNTPISQNYYSQIPIYQNINLPTNLIEQTQNSIQNLLTNLKNENPKHKKNYNKINHQSKHLKMSKTSNNIKTKTKSNSKSKYLFSVPSEHKRNKIHKKSRMYLEDSQNNRSENLSFNEKTNSDYSFNNTQIITNKIPSINLQTKITKHKKRDLSEDFNNYNKVKIQIENLRICNKRNKSEISNINSEFDMLKNDILLQLTNYLKKFENVFPNNENPNNIDSQGYNNLIVQVSEMKNKIEELTQINEDLNKEKEELKNNNYYNNEKNNNELTNQQDKETLQLNLNGIQK